MKPTDPNYAKLRQDAEAKFARAPKLRPRPPEVLLHELEVHQIELEMQNEQLRQVQVELEISRDRYVDFYDFAPAGYLTLNREGLIEEANLTGAVLLGVERSKLLHRRYVTFVDAGDRERFHRHFMSVLERDSKLSCELGVRRGDGSCFQAQMDCLRLKKQGEKIVVRIVLTDITERKQLETARQEALDKFQKVTELAPGVVYQFRLHPNGNTSFPYVSEVFHKIFRLNPAEVRKDASKAFALVHPDDLESLMASIQTSARNLTAWQHEFRLKFDDGTLCWLLGNSQPQREANGSTLWHGFLTDITQRKQAELSMHGYLNELALHNRVLEMISQDVPLTEILDALARHIEALHPEMLCSIRLLEKSSKALYQGAAPSLPDAYRHSLDDLNSNDSGCSCDETRCCCTRIDMDDVQHRFCKRARLAGMQSCLTQPIVNGEGRVLGTFTLYHRQPVMPWDARVTLLESYVNLAKLAIEREYARRVLLSEQELKMHQIATRELSAHLHAMREEEKTDIAREIHDDLGGTLTALKMGTYWLAEELSSNKDATPLIEHIESMAQLVDNATDVVRRVISGLRPTILDDLGLPAALEWYAAQFSKRSGIECRVNCVAGKGAEKLLSKMQAINLFRIFQEALTNVSKHSGASRVEVELFIEGEGEGEGEGEVLLSISDNGRGKKKKRTDTSKSYGILGMTERVEQLGGKIKFVSPRSGGFCVSVSLPSTRNNNGRATV